MRASTAYFAGAGTVIAAIAGGVGGGLLFADMVSPKAPKQEMTRLEQRMSAQPIQVKAASEAGTPTTPPPVATAPAEKPVEKPLENATAPAAAPAASQSAAAAPAPSPPPAPSVISTPAAASTPQDAPPVQAAVPPASPEKSAAPAIKQATAAPEDSFAKARDVDMKRAATEKRRSERRQQWSEKRRLQQRQDPDRELREVEAKVREETESRPLFAAETQRVETPRIRLFDLD